MVNMVSFSYLIRYNNYFLDVGANERIQAWGGRSDGIRIGSSLDRPSEKAVVLAQWGHTTGSADHVVASLCCAFWKGYPASFFRLFSRVSSLWYLSSPWPLSRCSHYRRRTKTGPMIPSCRSRSRTSPIL